MEWRCDMLARTKEIRRQHPGPCCGVGRPTSLKARTLPRQVLTGIAFPCYVWHATVLHATDSRTRQHHRWLGLQRQNLCGSTNALARLSYSATDRDSLAIPFSWPDLVGITQVSANAQPHHSVHAFRHDTVFARQNHLKRHENRTAGFPRKMISSSKTF